jgi:Ca2+-transporting ATPase
MPDHSILDCKTPWAASVATVTSALQSDPERGLAVEEALRRYELFGPNRLTKTAPPSLLRQFFDQLFHVMNGLLAAAALTSGLIGHRQDALLIGAIVIANAVIGTLQERKADRAAEALQQLSRPHCRVRRGGLLRDLAAEQLTLGDIVLLEGGDLVPADGRVLHAVDLHVDESTLTGESLPVAKDETAVSSQQLLPDRTSMLHAGTSLSRGHATMIVTQLGMQTELGKVALLLQTTKHVPTPLQRKLNQLGKRITIGVLLVCLLVFLIGILRAPADLWDQILLTAVSLAVAAIPEGLPTVIALTLALGSREMARRNAIVRKLTAVETLGSVDVICTDKTGTLTQNRMEVAEFHPADRDADSPDALLHVVVLCNNAEVSEGGELLGTATERALLQAALDRGVEVPSLRARWPRVAEWPFDSQRKLMSTEHRTPEGDRVMLSKGAAEAILTRCELPETQEREILKEVETYSARGQRVLAFARRTIEEQRLPSSESDPETGLTFLGLITIEDPIRPEAFAALEACRSAGIGVVMITGDHPGTARAIAESLGILERIEPDANALLTGVQLDELSETALTDRILQTKVYARVSPEHKIRVVRAYQARNLVVSMTGDGVNDAPALRQADIGVAMGRTGTDVSREAADLILSDDNFATIVAAVRQGRAVYDNIKKFVRFLLTANTGEIFVLVLAIAAGLPLPLLPVQLLWINLVTDGLPALALGFERADPNVMNRPPHRDPILDRKTLWSILRVGAWIGVSCVLLFQAYLPPEATFSSGHDLDYARTMVFWALTMAQLFYVLSVRSTSQFIFSRQVPSNPRLLGAIGGGILLQVLITFHPTLQRYFHTVTPSMTDLGIATTVAVTATLLAEIFKRRFVRNNRL